MITVLSRSRYKAVYFLDHPFTTADVIQAHEAAFFQFEGVPQQMVYDQDKLMVVSENAGDILYTEKFTAYLKVRKFTLFICRGSDPETKGKSESVIKYVKSSFLNQREFVNIEVLQAECLAWLERTGNGQEHGTTKCIPAQDFLAEKAHLQALNPIALPFLEYKVHHVRKDNLISWKSNRYSVPVGTYKGKGTQVWVKEEGEELIICREDKTPLASHKISPGKGLTFINSNHKRDRSQKVQQIIEQVATYFSKPEKAQAYFIQIQEDKPRYIRDQLQIIKKAADRSDTLSLDQALDFCSTHTILSANDFRAVLEKFNLSDQVDVQDLEPLLLNSVDRSQYAATPQKSSIAEYESIVNPQ